MSALDGKVAIVSGAAQGLGEGFARSLSQAGASVLAFDVQDKVTQVAEAIEQETGNRVLGMVADVSKRSDVEQVVASAVETFGGIDILVNNAGAWKPTLVDSSWEQAVEDWDTIMDTKDMDMDTIMDIMNIMKVVNTLGTDTKNPTMQGL